MNKIIKETLILTAITLISGLLLGAAYEVTKDPIAKQEAKAKQEACKNVFEKADSFDAKNTVDVSDASRIIKNFKGCTIDECVKALDADKKEIGYVLTVTTTEGYGGNITFAMGVTKEGTMNGIDILSISETAGLGMKAKEADFKNQFSNKQVLEFSVVKDGKANDDSKIQAISSATITSKAVTNAVNAGLAFCASLNKEGGSSNE